MIPINIDTTQVLQARQALRELNDETQKLEDELNKLKTMDVVTPSQTQRINDLSAAIDDNNTAIQGLNQTIGQLDSNNLTASFEDLYGAIQPVTGQIGELEDRMYQLALSGQANSEEFQQLAERAGQMRAAVQQTDAQVDAMTLRAKGIGGISQAFSGVKDSLMNLDFKTAATQMTALNGAMKGGEGGLKGLFTGLKTATTGVWQFTAALLANPIILIGAIIVGVGVALYKLKDSLGIVGKMFDAIGDAIGWVMDMFQKGIDVINAFTDALGWTNVAQQKEAEAAHKIAEQKVKDQEDVDYARQKELDSAIAEIQMKDKLTEKDIWNIGYLRKQKLLSTKAVIEANAEEAYSYIKMQELKGDLDDEEKEELEQRKRDFNKYKADYQDINKKIELNTKQTAKEVREFRKNETEQANEENKKRAENNKKAKDEQLKKEEEFRKKYEDIVKKSEDAINKILYDDKLDKITNEYDKQIEVVTQKLEDEKTKVLQILTDEKNMILANTKLTGEEREAQLKKNAENEEKVKTYYANKTTKEVDAINAKREEDNTKKTEDAEAKRLEIRQHYIDQTKNENEKKYKQDLLDLETYYTNLLKNTELSEKERADIEAEYATKRGEAALNFLFANNKAIKDAKAKEREEEIAETVSQLNAVNGAIKSGLDAIGSTYSEGLGNILGGITSGFENIASALNDPNLTGEEKSRAIAQASLQAAASVLNGVNDILSAVSQANQEKTQEQLDNVDKQFNQQTAKLQEQLDKGIISQEEFDRQKYQMDLQRYNQEEAIKKKSFEQDKKMKIAQASIAMVQGMLSAFSGAMQLGPPAGPIVGGILAAAVGVMGAMNIAKIKATKYESGTAPTAPSVPNIATPQLAADMNETGMSSEYSQNKAASSTQNTGKQEMVVKVESTVSVTELETTSNKVKKYEDNGEL